MSLTEKEVRHVAKLAAIEVCDSDLDRMKEELSDILDYVAKLQSVSSRGVVPTAHVHGSTNFFRDDVHQDSVPVERIAENAPEFVESFFRVPKIL